MTEIPFEELKRIQLEILDDIDLFCKREGLRYSLAYGTLLGSIRHKGYIPWDDDIDLMMPRPDYDRFLATYRSDQNEVIDLSALPACVETFAKVSRKGTLMVDDLLGRGMWGANVDIFPLDGIPMEGMESFYERMTRKKDLVAKICPFYRVVGHGRAKWFVKYLLKRIHYPSLKSAQTLKQELMAEIRSQSYEEAAVAGTYFESRRTNEFMDKAIYEGCIDLPFEGKTYLGLKRYDDYLTHIYGDYMTPPPADGRVSAHQYKVYRLD